MSRFAAYANLFDKAQRMVNSKMWATPLWYDGVRRAPPPLIYVYPDPPRIKLPEMQYYKTVMKRIPVLKLEKQFGGQNPFVGNERSLAWKFAKRQLQYVTRLKMSEEDAFKATERDLDPEIHEMVSNLHKVPVDETTPYSFLIGTGLEKEDFAKAKMVSSSTPSVHSIRANLERAKADASVQRARKRAAGEVPTPKGATEIMEEKLSSSRPIDNVVQDPLYGPPNLVQQRVRQFNKQIGETGIESVQRRFMEKPSATHETLRTKLNINNPTAEFLAQRILPDSKEVSAFREQVDADVEAYTARLDAFTNAASTAGLTQLQIFPSVSVAEIALQADKLRAFRTLCLAATPPPTEEKETGVAISEVDNAKLQAFVAEWTDPEILKEKLNEIKRELVEMSGEAADAAWEKDKQDHANKALRRDVFGHDVAKVDKFTFVHEKYHGLLRELATFHAQQDRRTSLAERIEKRRQVRPQGATKMR